MSHDPDDRSVTVGELIEILKRYPADAPVLYKYHSDYAELHANELEFRNVLNHNGHWMDWEDDDKPKNMVLIFPGN